MNNNNNNPEEQEYSYKDYLKILYHYKWIAIPIAAVCLILSILYAMQSVDIYSSTAVIKISQPKGNILNTPLIPEMQNYENDRFIADEIEIMKSNKVRTMAAKALYDSLKNNKFPFELFKRRNFYFSKDNPSIPTTEEITGLLSGVISIDQKRGLDILNVTAESPSPEGAALIANTYVNEYMNKNLEINRNQLTMIKGFLAEQLKEKKQTLNEAENTLMNYQEKGGVVSLDDQAKTLITQISQFEAQRDMAKINFVASNKSLTQYKDELRRQSPQMATYLESLGSESYFKELQDAIAKFEISKDVALMNKGAKVKANEIVPEYDLKIKDLRNKLDDKLKVFKAGVLASSPQDIKLLTQKIIDEEINSQSLSTTIKEMDALLKQYDIKFEKLPKTSTELARFERDRESTEKLYSLIEERYQEALINEQSQPGNVLIIDEGKKPSSPSKPNRPLIILIGFIIGCALAFASVIVKNYFDDTIKTPEDIEKRNVNLLAWIPKIEELNVNAKEFEFIIFQQPKAHSSEAYKTLRTRLQFAKINEAPKTILITSAGPGEGKTITCLNLAGSYAQSSKKTLLLDCDIRKPRLHSIFEYKRVPGLIDYLFGYVSLEEIIHPVQKQNLHLITAGTIPANPTEMLDSTQMRYFLDELKRLYDFIIIDSAPLISIADSEILASLADAVILVASANLTKTEMLDKAVEVLKRANAPLVGTVLNNYAYKNGYGYYYKYYYDYTENGKVKKKSKIKVDTENISKS